MRHSLVPLVVLVVLPFAYFAWRLGLLKKGLVLWVCGAAMALLLAIHLPFQGVGAEGIEVEDLMVGTETDDAILERRRRRDPRGLP